MCTQRSDCTDSALSAPAGRRHPILPAIDIDIDHRPRTPAWIQSLERQNQIAEPLVRLRSRRPARTRRKARSDPGARRPRPAPPRRTARSSSPHTPPASLDRQGVIPEGGQGGRVRPASGEGGGGIHGVRGCLGRIPGPGTWLSPRSPPTRAPLAPLVLPPESLPNKNRGAAGASWAPPPPPPPGPHPPPGGCWGAPRGARAPSGPSGPQTPSPEPRAPGPGAPPFGPFGATSTNALPHGTGPRPAPPGSSSSSSSPAVVAG